MKNAEVWDKCFFGIKCQIEEGYKRFVEIVSLEIPFVQLLHKCMGNKIARLKMHKNMHCSCNQQLLN